MDNAACASVPCESLATGAAVGRSLFFLPLLNASMNASLKGFPPPQARAPLRCFKILFKRGQICTSLSLTPRKARVKPTSISFKYTYHSYYYYYYYYRGPSANYTNFQ